MNWFKCTFQERDDGIYFCEGLHHRSADCVWEKLTIEHVKDMARQTQSNYTPLGYNANVVKNK